MSERGDSHTRWLVGVVGSAIVAMLAFFAVQDRTHLEQSDSETKDWVKQQELAIQRHAVQLGVLSTQYAEFRAAQESNMAKLERRLDSIEANQKELIRLNRRQLSLKE